MRLLFADFVLGVLVCFPLLGALPGTVTTATGPVEGVRGKDPKVSVYRGIPYAEAPVGPLRWKAPVPVAPWRLTRRAEHFGAHCVQNITDSRLPWTEEFMAHGATSEDCLTLNIWTAATKADEGRPVIVFLHGGGYREGSGAIATYDGESMAMQGVVMVTVNYRLGVFGFFAHPELSQESGKGASGNYGLMDQIEALRWVKKSIAAFGGDPEKVTIAGQSAGAGSVTALCASPLAKGLFHRALAESGTGIASSAMGGKAEAEKAGAEWAAKLGAKSLKGLRDMEAEALLKGPATPTRPIVDGWVLPESPMEALRNGRFADVPYMTGYNADESTRRTMDAAQFATWAKGRFGDLAEEVLKLYKPEEVLEVARDRNRASMWMWAEERAKHTKKDAFLYFFTRAIPWPEHPEFGAFHTSEVPYVYGTLKAVNHPVTDLDYAIGARLQAWVVNFARTGDPNGKDLPDWAAFDAKVAVVEQVGETFQPIRVATRDRLAFWRKFLATPAGATGNVFF